MDPVRAHVDDVPGADGGLVQTAADAGAGFVDGEAGGGGQGAEEQRGGAQGGDAGADDGY